jgi:hypothetical protein
VLCLQPGRFASHKIQLILLNKHQRKKKTIEKDNFIERP